MAICALPVVLLFLQMPGDGLGPVQAHVREVRRIYWELQQTTEIRLRLVPEDPDGKPPLVELTFQAFFPGRAEWDPYSGLPKWPKGPPAQLAVRAQPLPLTVIRDLSLRLVIDGTTIELTGPGGRYRNIPCLIATDDCAPNGVEADLEPGVLRSSVKAHSVEGEALGFRIRLTRADQVALGEFMDRIGLSEAAESTR